MNFEPPAYVRFSGKVPEGVKDYTFDIIERHPTLPLTLQREFFDKGETTGWFRHVDFIALYAVRQGRGVHWIDDTAYGITRGDIYLLAPGATHRFYDYANLEIDACYFQPRLFSEEELTALRELPGFWRLFVGAADVEHRIHLTPQEWMETEQQIEAMRREWAESALSGSLMLKHEIFRLLVLLARRLEGRKPVQPGAKAAQASMAEAIRYCEENFDKALTVPQLAARFFLSPGHFSELFRREAGMTPAAYLRQIRLEKAAALLRAGTGQVTQVAAQCGFGDPAHFSRLFRAQYHLSPQQYRKHHVKS